MTEPGGRLTRLEALTEVWGYLYFFHPGLAVPDERWETALETTISLVERAASADAFAAALNEGLLVLLDDPWTVASVAGIGALDESDEQPIESVVRPDDVGYIRCPSNVFDHPYYPTLMRRAITAIEGADRVVLDLRWGRPPRPWPNLHRRPRFSTEDCWPAAIFGFFLDEAVPTPSRWERMHTGWSEEGWSHYGETPRLRPGEPLPPVRQPPFFLEQRYPAVPFDTLPSYCGKLAVIVDDHSIGWLDHGLAALQQAGRAFVVHETDGEPRHRGEPLRVTGGVQVRTRPYRLVAEPVPDRTLREYRDGMEAMSAAVELLDAAAPAVVPPGTAAPPETPRPAPRRAPATRTGVTTEPGRERRLHGLLKIWAVLGEFFPHAELADIDWRNGLPDWIRRVESAGDTSSYYRVLLEFAARLNDSHSGTPGVEHPAVDGIRGTHTPPIRLGRVAEGVAVIELHTPDLEDQVPHGAIVTHVDGRPVPDIAAERSRLRSASTPQALDHWLYESGGVLAGPRDSEARITLAGKPEPRELTLSRTIENRHWLLNRRPAGERLEDPFRLPQPDPDPHPGRVRRRAPIRVRHRWSGPRHPWLSGVHRPDRMCEPTDRRARPEPAVRGPAAVGIGPHGLAQLFLRDPAPRLVAVPGPGGRAHRRRHRQLRRGLLSLPAQPGPGDLRGTSDRRYRWQHHQHQPPRRRTVLVQRDAGPRIRRAELPERRDRS